MLEQYTVNGLLSIQKALRIRLSQLNDVKNSSTNQSIFLRSGEESRIEKPTYDIKKVDTKIVEINRALTYIDMKIKDSNAKTNVDIQLDLDSLTSPLE